MKQLKDYLGIWHYSHEGVEKYCRIVPQGNKFCITWGDKLGASLSNPQRMTVIDAPEAFRRIRSKARGGYTLISPYSGDLPASADLKVEDLYPQNKPSANKPKPQPKKKFNFLDWLGSDWTK